MNKFVKALVIINGLMFPIFILFLIFKMIPSQSDGISYGAESIIVGEGLEAAKKEGLALQGISFENPLDIYNSTNFYLPISAMTFEEARILYDESSRAADMSSSWYNYFNVLFLDKDHNVIGHLLDKKATITEIGMPYGRYGDKIDESVRHISYYIGFEDSNTDGKLNSNDAHDLYITDLSGKNLTQVTNQKDVLQHEFIEENTFIFIRYTERDSIRDEHKRIKFGRYNISAGKFDELKGIDEELTKIENMLLN